MREPRTPVRDTYDAIIDLAMHPETGPYAYALVKQTFRIAGQQGVIDAPEPLEHDMRDPEIDPVIKPGTDFWYVKTATDVVVQGSAYAPFGRATPQMEVAVSVGSFSKEIAVFGQRWVEWAGHGQVRITPPEPMEEMPLIWENAYGGADFRVTDPTLENAPPEVLLMKLQRDHPGLYPRNPFGKGYLVQPDPVEDFEMPNLEDPSNLLTPARLITRDPRLWHQQPLPWCYEWVHPMMFPRYVHFLDGPDAWYPGPEDRTLPEVQQGFVAPGFRTASRERHAMLGPMPAFYQGASHGLVVPGLLPNTPVSIRGMHPEEPNLMFQVPSPPRIEMQVEHRREVVKPRLHSLVCRPADRQCTLLYGAVMDLTRPFIPGIHKYIPLAVHVNGDFPVAYEAPVPIREQIAGARGQQTT
ncbi:MAG TPA: DUF2169 domain-containing protein [Rhodothermales bacterium]|nr:DUF2169 domain-containing protein [Rhodothermales bacterium]